MKENDNSKRINEKWYWIFILILFISVRLILPVYAGGQTKLTGHTSLSYTEIYPEKQSDSSWSQTLSLRWIDQLYRNKITLGTDLIVTKSQGRDPQIRPTWSMDIRGYQYDLIMKYSEYRDSEYQGGQSTLISKFQNINLTLRPPDLPRISIVYSGSRYLDDQEIHTINSKNERLTVKTDYRLGDLSISASRSEYTFWSRPEREDIQTFAGLIALSVDPVGYVYTISNLTYKIQVYTAGGGFVREWGGFGSGVGQFLDPVGIAVDNAGFVYVTDAQLHSVQKFTYTGDYVTQWGGFGSDNGRFNRPNGIAVDNTGYIYIVDQDNHRIQKFTNAGSFIMTWGNFGSGEDDFNNPAGIAIDQNGDIYVTDMGNHRIQKFSNAGDFIQEWGLFGSDDAQFNQPTGITVDDLGYVYIMDYGNQRIQRFSTVGIYIQKWNAHGTPSGNSIFGKIGGRIYLADIQNGLVEIYSTDGAFLSSFGDFVTVTSSESKYKTITEQLALNYFIRPNDYFDFNFGYNLTQTQRQGTSIATTESIYQQFQFGWKIYPHEIATLYGDHYKVISESERNSVLTQDSESLTHNIGMTLRPYQHTYLTLGYSESEFTESTTSNTRSESGSINIVSQLYPDLRLNSNFSHSETYSMDTKTTISNQISLTLTAQLLPEAAADLYATYNESDNLQDENFTASHIIGLRWRSRPTEKILWNQSIQYSQNKTETMDTDSISVSRYSQIAYTTEINYWFRSYLNLFINSSYMDNSQQTDNLTYTTGFTWRPKNNFYMTNSFSQTYSSTDSMTYSSNMEFRFRHQIRLSLGYRYFDQEEKEPVHTVSARLTKTF